MRAKLVLLLTALAAATSIAGDLSPKDLVAQLYQAHRSKHDPLDETALLDRYFDPALLKLYLKDKGIEFEEKNITSVISTLRFCSST